MTDYGPRTPFADELHGEKYRSQGESFREAMNRVAGALKDSDAHYQALREVLLDMRFLPAGRIQASMGSMRETTPYNCLHGSTPILLREGVRRLDQIIDRDVEILSPITGRWHRTRFRYLGDQKTQRIRIAFGSRSDGATFDVIATPNHRWLRRSGVFTDNLQVGDLLSAALRPPTMEDDESYLCGFVHGFVFGDGFRDQTRENSFLAPLCADKDRLHEDKFIAAHCERLQWASVKWPVYRVTSNLDLKQVPPEGSPIEYIAGFLGGWIAADGCLHEDNSRPLMLHSVNREALEWASHRLPLAGFVRSGGLGRTPAGQATNFGPRRQDLFCLYFWRCDEHRGMRVVKITPRRVDKVYCCEVPEGGSAFVISHGLASGNCFVSGTIDDSYVDGHGSIMNRAVEAARTMRYGGGIGYDFSTLRPRGSLIRRLQSSASGPVSFMHIFDAVCRATSSSGHRRGAQMGVLRVDHPDILEFVRAKQNQDKLTGFNISVAVTDEFMRAVKADQEFPLRWNGETYRTVRAAELWEAIMRSTWDWAEPGVLFIDRINGQNNLGYCETIAATNPCGEQPLPPYGACLLGSFNLVKYLCPKDDHWGFDWDQFDKDIPVVVRAMDNVVDRARYPLREQEIEAQSKRRMGLGVTGLANALEAMGLLYGERSFVVVMEQILEVLRDGAYAASAELAREKGPFPKFDRDGYLNSPFVGGLPEGTLQAIYRHGIRNSHLTSIAPTGTISLCADNVSSGIEPVFAYSVDRTYIGPEGERQVSIEDYAFRELGVRGRQCSEVGVDEHLAVLTAAYRFVDSAVSKTCNVPSDTSWETFKDLYLRAWAGGCKGCTTFRLGGRRGAMMVEAASCRVDPVTGRKECE